MGTMPAVLRHLITILSALSLVLCTSVAAMRVRCDQIGCGGSALAVSGSLRMVGMDGFAQHKEP
jgi:hypothetical protein